MSKRARIIAFVSFIQSTLFFTHFFIYKTWTFAAAKNGTSALWLKVTVGALSVSFLAASLLAFRYSNRTVRTLYRIAAVWLGIVSFLFFAAGASWVVFGATRLVGVNVNFHAIVEVLYAAAVLIAVAGLLNAGWTRIRRITVRLENLPETGRGRTAALGSDLPLGPVRQRGVFRRGRKKEMREKPDSRVLAGGLVHCDAIQA